MEMDPGRRRSHLARPEVVTMRSIPNRRVRVYEADEIARTINRTFKAREVESEDEMPFSWPSRLQYAGDSYGVAYASDKWKKRRGDFELYKHIAESRNRAFVRPGFLRDFDNPKKPWPIVGPMIDFTRFPMPDTGTELALFEEIDLRLHVGGTHADPRFGKSDEGYVKVTLAHGLLGGGKICWSKTTGDKDQPFLFVYNEKDGVQIIVVGDELDIEKDGIVG